MLLEKTESGSALTTTDNFDVVPVKYPNLERSLTSKLRKRKSKKKKKRAKVDIEWGPDAYSPDAGE